MGAVVRAPEDDRESAGASVDCAVDRAPYTRIGFCIDRGEVGSARQVCARFAEVSHRSAGAAPPDRETAVHRCSAAWDHKSKRRDPGSVGRNSPPVQVTGHRTADPDQAETAQPATSDASLLPLAAPSPEAASYSSPVQPSSRFISSIASGACSWGPMGSD